MMEWSLSKTGEKHIKKFNAYQSTYQLLSNKIKMGGSLVDAKNLLLKTIENGIQDAKKQANYQPGDKIRIVSLNENFNHPISTVMGTKATIEHLIEQIENIVTSDRKVDIHKTTFDIQILKIPKNV